MTIKTREEMKQYNKQYYKTKTAEKPCCFVCNKHFTPVKYSDENGVQVVEMMIGHSVCSALFRKQKKLKEDLLDLDYALYKKSLR